MAKTKPIESRATRGICIAVDSNESPSMEEYRRLERDNMIGAEPPGGIPHRDRPEATRTTARPWGETNNRKPYLPTEDVSTPSLDEGLSFRQSF